MIFKRIRLCNVVSLSVLFLLPGCQYDPHAHLLTTKEPLFEDIVGTYSLDRFDLANNIPIKNLEVKVELCSDGTFTATNIPPSSIYIPDSSFFSGLLSGKGRWQKAEVGVLDPGSKKIWGINFQAADAAFRTDDNQFHSAELAGDKSPYGLIFELGDPDQGYAVLLKKE